MNRPPSESARIAPANSHSGRSFGLLVVLGRRAHGVPDIPGQRERSSMDFGRVIEGLDPGAGESCRKHVRCRLTRVQDIARPPDCYGPTKDTGHWYEVG